MVYCVHREHGMVALRGQAEGMVGDDQEVMVLAQCMMAKACLIMFPVNYTLYLIALDLGHLEVEDLDPGRSLEAD